MAAITNSMGEEAREEELVGVLQKELSFKVDKERRRRLMEEVGEEEVEERARLLSLTLPWLNVAPIFTQCVGGRGGKVWLRRMEWLMARVG